MVHPEKTRLFLVAALLALAGLTACESAAEREERLAREAYIESLDIEELKKDLETVNPDPYARDKTRTGNIGSSKSDSAPPLQQAGVRTHLCLRPSSRTAAIPPTQTVIAGLVPAIHARNRRLTSLKRRGAAAEWGLGTRPRPTTGVVGYAGALAASDLTLLATRGKGAKLAPTSTKA